MVESIESSRFKPLQKLQWRNSALDFGSVPALIASLEAGSDHPDLVRAREADDLVTLRALSDLPETRRRVVSPRDVRLLWDVCQIPDFRKVSEAEHAGLSARLFGYLQGGGQVPTDWLARQISRIDRTEGDIDALSKRLAYIRTWTYVAQRRGWIDDSDHWRDETRAVEDRLSDALHARLTQRFVDRRTSVLMRRLKQRESLVASVTESGEVTIDEQFVGRLEGFRFRLDPSADAEAVRTLRAAAVAALAPVLSLRADKLYNAPDTEFDITEQGGLMWGEYAVGRLSPGAGALSPQVQVFADDDVDPEIGTRVARRLSHFVDRRIAALFEPLIALRDDATLAGMARGIGYRLVELLGILPRGEVADDLKSLDQDQRAGLRKHGVRFGQFTVFLPALLKPAPTRLRLVLWSLAENLDEFPEAPPPGLVTVPALAHAPRGYYPRAGYRLAGERAIRIDMLERLADMLRPLDARGGFEAGADMLSITGLTLEQFASLMQGLGYDAARDTRAKQRPAPAAETPVPADPTAEADAPGSPEPDAGGTPDVIAVLPDAAEVRPAEDTAPDQASSAEPAASEGMPDAAEAGPAEGPVRGTEAEAKSAEPAETEVFFVFTRGQRRRQPRRDAAPGQTKGGRTAGHAGAGPGGKRNAGKGHGRKPKPGNDAPRPDKPRAPRPEKKIDPDNPFAALLALKTDT